MAGPWRNWRAKHVSEKRFQVLARLCRDEGVPVSEAAGVLHAVFPARPAGELEDALAKAGSYDRDALREASHEVVAVQAPDVPLALDRVLADGPLGELEVDAREAMTGVVAPWVLPVMAFSTVAFLVVSTVESAVADFDIANVATICFGAIGAASLGRVLLDRLHARKAIDGYWRAVQAYIEGRNGPERPRLVAAYERLLVQVRRGGAAKLEAFDALALAAADLQSHVEWQRELDPEKRSRIREAVRAVSELTVWERIAVGANVSQIGSAVVPLFLLLL